MRTRTHRNLDQESVELSGLLGRMVLKRWGWRKSITSSARGSMRSKKWTDMSSSPLPSVYHSTESSMRTPRGAEPLDREMTGEPIARTKCPRAVFERESDARLGHPVEWPLAGVTTI